MSANEAGILSSLIIYSAVVGAVWGCLSGRRGATRGLAAIGAVVTAALTSLLFFIVPSFIGGIVRHGLSIESIQEAAVGSLVIALLLLFAIPWITVLPSFVMAVLVHGVATRRLAKSHE